MYRVVKCKPWIKDMQELLDKYEKAGWQLVSHAGNSGTAGHTFIFKK